MMKLYDALPHLTYKQTTHTYMHRFPSQQHKQSGISGQQRYNTCMLLWYVEAQRMDENEEQSDSDGESDEWLVACVYFSPC